MVSEFADARVILERGHLQLKHKQRDDDGEPAVTERLDARQAQFATAKTIKKKMHDEPRASKRILTVVPVGKIASQGGGNAEDRNESANLVYDGNSDAHHTERPIDARCNEPNPDERRCTRLLAPIQQASAEQEHGQDYQSDDNEH
jgi:hypothetical protein